MTTQTSLDDTETIGNGRGSWRRRESVLDESSGDSQETGEKGEKKFAVNPSGQRSFRFRHFDLVFLFFGGSGRRQAVRSQGNNSNR